MNYQTRQLPFGAQHRGGQKTARKINPSLTVYRTNKRAGGVDAPPPPPPAPRFVPRRQRIALDAALVASRVNIAGNVFWVTSASGSDAVAQVQFVKGSDVSDVVDIASGFRLWQTDYDYVLITCSAQASKYLIVTYGTAPAGVEGDTI